MSSHESLGQWLAERLSFTDVIALIILGVVLRILHYVRTMAETGAASRSGAARRLSAAAPAPTEDA